MTLRERRRRQTARDIQMATLTISLQNGYDSVTTEAIAAEAGISTRTFFNYYPNKQSAILGEAITLFHVTPDWFITSTAPLAGDIVRLMGQGLQDDPPNRQTLRMILQVIALNPALPDLFRKRMDETALDLFNLLTARLGPDRAVEARLLAELSTTALAKAVSRWAAEDAMQIDDILHLIEATLLRVGCLLTESA